MGIVLGLEVSRLARNNADWYRLLDLCAMTDTLIGDSDGIYHPALFNDRLILGLKGTMSEAELHILRARLYGGIRNKAARGELRRGLPVGFVWGEEDGEVRFNPMKPDRCHPYGVLQVHGTWIGLQGLALVSFRRTLLPVANDEQPDSLGCCDADRHPECAHQPGVWWRICLRKIRHERCVDEQGRLRRRTRHLPQTEWAVLLTDHHPGFIDWATYQANQARIDANVHPRLTRWAAR